MLTFWTLQRVLKVVRVERREDIEGSEEKEGEGKEV